MTLSFWQDHARAAELTGDVVVVGGGIIGTATAYWLRRLRPALRVLLVEAQGLGAGASGRNAGFVMQGTTHDYFSDLETIGADRSRRLWQFTRENRDLLFSELRGRAFNLEASGGMRVAGSAEEDARLRASVPHLRAHGIPVAYIPADETNRRLVARGFSGGLYVPSDAMLNPLLLVRHLAEESGAVLLEHHPVLGIHGGAGGAVVETRARRIRADRLVLALNAYLPQLYPALARYVRPVRAQMLATEPLLPRWLRLPVSTHEGFFYLRQAPDGSVLLGGARHLHLQEEVGYVDEATGALQADLEAYLHHHFPQAQGLRVRRRWSGVMGFSPDHLPVIGAVPDLGDSYWAAGFTGHGMAFGFRFGRLLAELMLGYAHPEGFDLFHVERFRSTRPEAALRRA